jgi:FKBP-type peptidyl-prolyl cis-trans isomerase FkpA
MNLRNQIACMMALTALTLSACKSKSKIVKLKSGISYQVIKAGNGKENAKIDDVITMHIRAYVSDSMLFDSYKLNDNKPVPAQITKAQFNGDIMEVIQLMKEGDSLVAKVPQDSIFRQEGMKPPFAKKGDSVIYQLKLVSVKSKAEFDKEETAKNAGAIQKEDGVITKYFADNKIAGAQKLASGMYVQVITPGSGPNVTAGNEVTMNYTGMLLDGKKFDSNVDPKFGHVQPFKFTLGKGMVIKGWDEGVAQLNKGAKARLYIPSPLAYGANSPSPEIPNNSILIFDVEVVSFGAPAVQSTNGK